MINTAYSDTPPDSPLRKLICHIVSREYFEPENGPSIERRRAFLDHAHQDFILDLLGGKTTFVVPEEQPVPRKPRIRVLSCGFEEPWGEFGGGKWLYSLLRSYPKFHLPNFDKEGESAGSDSS